jgi:protease II
MFLLTFISANELLDELPESYPQGSLWPPITKIKPYNHIYHGRRFNDPYEWIKSEGLNSNDVKQLIRNETTYAQQVFKESRSLRIQIFQDLLKASDNSMSRVWESGDYLYYSR